MANKRIELEQYRCYVNLFDEEPNRKKVKAGVVIAMVSATLLVVLIFVLGLLSGNLVTNPRNVLEKPAPPAASPEDAVPGMNIPGQEGGLPTDISIPVEQNGEVPPGTTPPGGSLPLGSAGGVLTEYGTPLLPPAGAHDGALLAQAEPAATPEQEGAVEVPVQVDPTVTPASPEPVSPASTAPVDEKADGEKQEDAGPSTETKGVGNLSNLAEQVSGRGFQIYMLLLTIALGVVIYLTLKRASREGKAR